MGLHRPGPSFGRLAFGAKEILRPRSSVGAQDLPSRATPIAGREARQSMRDANENEWDIRHGFAVHEDPQYLNPQSQESQALVIRTVTDWIMAVAASSREPLPHQGGDQDRFRNP
jgi:hypothetical protein